MTVWYRYQLLTLVFFTPAHIGPPNWMRLARGAHRGNAETDVTGGELWSVL